MGDIARIVKYIIGISVFIVIGLLIAYLIVFMNNGQKTFYVQYGETEIRNKAENLELPTNQILVFECKNSLGVGTKDYTVKIVFNGDFNFDVDTVPHQAKVLDITDNFNLIKNNEFFTLYISNNLTIFSILQNAFLGKTIKNFPTMEIGKDYFVLVVESTNNESDRILISFHLGG